MTTRARIAFRLSRLAAAGLACGRAFAARLGGGRPRSPQLLGSAPRAPARRQPPSSSTLYPILREHCADCHAGDGPGSPHIAHPSVATAYQNVIGQNKVNLADPAVVAAIVAQAGHEASARTPCWTSDCDDRRRDAAGRDRAVGRPDRLRRGRRHRRRSRCRAATLSLADGIEDMGSERYSTEHDRALRVQGGRGRRSRSTRAASRRADRSRAAPARSPG